MASDDDLRDKLTKAYMAREGCERVVDDHFTSYCTEHHAGWLHDVNACAHADVTVEDALMPVVREALAAAWDHGHRTANPVIPDTHRDVINPWKQP